MDKEKLEALILIFLTSFAGTFAGCLTIDYLAHQNQQPKVKIINNTYTKTYYYNYTKIYNNTRIYNYTFYKCCSPLEKILNEYLIFKTNQSIVPLEVENVSQFLNNFVLIKLYNLFSRNYTFIIAPKNESEIEPATGPNIPLQNILKILPNNQNLYLVLKINNPNNISESGIYYIGNFSGIPILSLSENANLTYLITNSSPNQLVNYLAAAINGKAITLIGTGYEVWNYSNAVWGSYNGSSIIIASSPQSIDEILYYVNLSAKIANIKTLNPGSDGILPVVIATNYNTSTYHGGNQSYKVYIIDPRDVVYAILLTPAQGQQLESKILNGQSLTPAVYLPLLAGITSGISKYTGNRFEGRKRIRDYDIFRDSTPLTY